MGRRQERYCPEGHDKHALGMSKRGECLVCRRARDRLRPHSQMHGTLVRARTGCPCERCQDAMERQRMRTPSLPVAPLVAILPPGEAGAIGGRRAVLTPSQQRQWYRHISAGLVSPRIADEWAVALGHHPIELWGDAWLSDQETA